MKTTHHNVEYEIVRETSKYNKYIKWYFRSYRPDGSLIASLGYKTRKEAEAFMERNHGKPFPIGNSFSVTHYIPRRPSC